jgi:hypothetical protein
MDTSGAKRPEEPTFGTLLAIAAIALVCRNHARRDHLGPVRSPDARFPSYFNSVEPPGPRRRHSNVVVERHGLALLARDRSPENQGRFNPSG